MNNTVKPEWSNRSAVWGGATTGLVVGLGLWLFFGDFEKVLWATVIGGIIGLGAELLGRLGDRLGK